MSELELSPNCLLVFIDETGHEEFSDAKHPVFGLGGCATINSLYDTMIRKPWQQIKSLHFGGPDIQFHASELKYLNEEQLKALCNFFQNKEFFRLYQIIKSNAPLPKEISAYQIVARGLLERIRDIATRCSLDSVALIFESSDRSDRFIERFFSTYQFEINGKIIPFERYRMQKSMHEAGLQVADVIIHTAGGQVRNNIKDIKKKRRDFECIFDNIDQRLVSKFEVEGVFTKDQIDSMLSA